MAASTRAIPVHPRWTHFRRRYLMPVAGAAAVGLVLGYFLADVNRQFRATEVLGVRTAALSSADTLTASIASAAGAPAVIDAAAASLGIDPGDLTARTTVVVESGTTLVDVAVVAESEAAAVKAATTVAAQAIADYQQRAAGISESVTARSRELLTSGKLGSAAAEAARETTLGTVAGTAQGQEVDGSVALTVVSPATGASRAGLSKTMGAAFGAAAGALLALLIVLSGAWRRQWRVRSAADLVDAAPGQEKIAGRVFTDAEMDRVAGLVLESGRSCVVLLDDGPTPVGGSRLARMLGDALRQHGLTVARVEVGGGESGPLTKMTVDDWLVGAHSAEQALSRPARTALAATVKSDVALVEIASNEAATALLHGQSDFAAVVEVKSGSRVGRVQDLVALLSDSGPLVVLTQR